MTTSVPSPGPTPRGLIEQWRATERALGEQIRMSALGPAQDVKIVQREVYQECIFALDESLNALLERESRCAEHETSLAEREKQFDKREADVIIREQDAAQWDQNIDRRRRESVTMQNAAEEAARELDVRKAKLDERKDELDKREALVLAREGRTDTKEAAQRDAQRRLDERAKEAYDRLAAIANREGQLDTRSAKLDERETRVTEREDSLKVTEHHWEQENRNLSEVAERLRVREVQVTARETRVTERESEDDASAHDLRLALTHIVSLDSDPVPPSEGVIIERVKSLKAEVQLSAGVSERDVREAREKGGTDWENRLRIRQERLDEQETEFRTLRILREKVDAALQNNPADTSPLDGVDIISRINGMKNRLARYDAVPMLDMLLDSGIMTGAGQKSGTFLPPLQNPEFTTVPTLTKEFTDLAARFREDGHSLRENGSGRYRQMGFTLMLVADEIDAVAKKVLGS